MPDAHFIVIGDLKSPDDEAMAFLEDVHDCRYYTYAQQEALGYECSPLIGSGSIQRRNVGFLEALKSKAEFILSVDDDNIPLQASYGTDIEKAFAFTSGIEIIGKNRWHDHGQHLRPQAKHRGFPYGIKPDVKYNGVANPKIGVAAGTCILDPDVDAITRLAYAPDVQDVSILAEAGYVVNPYTWTVFNSQATAVRREFVPAWFLWNHAGRLDDIFASLIVQRVMRDRGYYVHFGKPFAAQDRNEHSLIGDLKAELVGYENTQQLANVLDKIQLPNKSVIDDCRRIWETLDHIDFVDPRTVETANAFLNDVEKVL